MQLKNFQGLIRIGDKSLKKSLSQIKPFNENDKLTDLDFDRLPNVWIVLEISVKVREVCGS